MIPGIDTSNHPLLQGRHRSYLDTQLSRLGGPNFHELPINASVAPVHNNQRDGIHRRAIPRGKVAYEPNSLAGGCPFQAGMRGFVPFPAPVFEARFVASWRSSLITLHRQGCFGTAKALLSDGEYSRVHTPVLEGPR